MTREEQFIYSRISRRGFMGATAGATLAALAGREPYLLHGAQAAKPDAGEQPRPEDPADG